MSWNLINTGPWISSLKKMKCIQKVTHIKPVVSKFHNNLSTKYYRLYKGYQENWLGFFAYATLFFFLSIFVWIIVLHVKRDARCCNWFRSAKNSTRSYVEQNRKISEKTEMEKGVLQLTFALEDLTTWNMFETELKL